MGVRGHKSYNAKKTRIFRLHSCCSVSSFSKFNIVGSEATALGEMTQNNDHYTVQAIQDHYCRY